jgi:hypothetical protein
MDQGERSKENKEGPAPADETLPFSREQYDALIEASYYYDGRGRGQERNGETTNSRRARAYLKLLRWGGLRAGDAACLAKTKLRDDDSLVLYQAKVKGKASAPVCVLLPHEIAQELGGVPPGSATDARYFFWSGRSKRKSEVSNWIKIFWKVLSKATELFPKLFLEATLGRSRKRRGLASWPGLRCRKNFSPDRRPFCHLMILTAASFASSITSDPCDAVHGITGRVSVLLTAGPRPKR